MARAAAVSSLSTAAAQRSAAPLGEVIDGYVQESLQSNLALQTESLEVERNLASLDARAERASFPRWRSHARYSRAEGGREIDVPLGTLLNPVYSIAERSARGAGTAGAVSADRRPDDQLRQREREQDTRVTLRQPLYAPAIPAAIRAQRAQLEAAEFGRVALARRLKRDVTVAYLDWLKATKTVDIVQASVSLLEENLRVNDSLFRNGKMTQDQVLRARAELLAVVQQLREARNGQSQARSYLNFLRNRALDDELIPAASRRRGRAHRARPRRAARGARSRNRPELGAARSRRARG